MKLVETAYPGIFVNTDGHVYRTSKTGHIYRVSGSPKTKTYLALTVERKTVLFHRLVYTTLIGDIPPGMEVNHKNGKKHDNAIDNLELTTPEENVEHAASIGRHVKRLSTIDCAEAIRKVLGGADVHTVANAYGIKPMYMHEIMRKEKRLNAWKLIGENTPTIPTSKMPAETCAQMIRDILAGLPKVEAQQKYGVSRAQVFKIMRKDFRLDAWELVEGSTTIETTPEGGRE